MTTMNKQFVLYAPLLNVERLDGVRSLDLFSIKIYQPTLLKCPRRLYHFYLATLGMRIRIRSDPLIMARRIRIRTLPVITDL